MEIYDKNMERIENPDLTIGHLKWGTRTEHHEAVEGVEEVSHYEVIAEYPNGGKDVQKVIDVPGVEAKEAWDEEIQIQIYIPYTQEELEAIEAERKKPTQEERIHALEERLASYEAAYMQGCEQRWNMLDAFHNLGRADAMRQREAVTK